MFDPYNPSDRPISSGNVTHVMPAGDLRIGHGFFWLLVQADMEPKLEEGREYGLEGRGVAVLWDPATGTVHASTNLPSGKAIMAHLK